MRWPFANWLRGAPGGDVSSTGTSEAAPSAADAGPGSPDVTRPAAWRDLPPVQRAVGEAPLTAPSAAFARDLAGRRVPGPMLAPLGHDVTAGGPAGLVSGLAVPLVQRATSGPDRPLAPALPAPAAAGRGRPTAQRATTSVATWPSKPAAEGAAGDAVAGEAVSEPVDEPAAGLPSPDVPGLAPRMLPVARLADAAPAMAATHVDETTAPAPIVAHAPSVGSGAQSAASMAAPAVAAPASTAADLAAPTPAPASDGAGEAGPALAAPDLPAPAVVGRRTLGESRRLGLGPPLAGRPPSLSRETGRPALPVARLARSAEPPGTTPDEAPIAAAVPATAAGSAPLPRLVVARRPGSAPGPVAGIPGAAPDSAEGVPVEAGVDAASDDATAPDDESAAGGATDAGVGTAGEARPLVGASPISVSRVAQDDARADADAGEAAGPGAAILRVAGAAIGPGPAVTGPEARGLEASGSEAPGSMSGQDPGSASASGIDGAGFEEPAGPAGPDAVQRSLGPRRGSPASGATGAGSAAAGPATGRSSPAPAPLASGRAIGAARAASLSTLGYAPSGDPAPALARLAIPGPGNERGSRDAGPGQTGVANTATFQRAAAPDAARPDRPVVSRAPLTDSHVQAPAASPGLPLARTAPAAAGPDAAAGPEAAESGRQADVVGWSASAGFTTTVAAEPGPFVQRAVTIDELSVTPGASGAASGAASAGQAGAAGAGGAGTDYEELAEHVYDRIRARLTTELLLDRERAGMLVDA